MIEGVIKELVIDKGQLNGQVGDQLISHMV